MKFIDDFKYMITDLVNPKPINYKTPIEKGVIDVSLIAEFDPSISESKIKEIAEDFKSIFNKVTNYRDSDIKTNNEEGHLIITYDLGNDEFVRVGIPPNYSLAYLPTIRKQKSIIKDNKIKPWVIIMTPHKKNENTQIFEPIKFTLWEFPSEIITFYPISQEICKKYKLQALPSAFKPIFIENKPAIEVINYPMLFKIKFLIEDMIKYEESVKQKSEEEKLWIEKLKEEDEKFRNLYKDTSNIFNESNIPGWGNNCFGKKVAEVIGIVKRSKNAKNNVDWIKQVEELIKKNNL